MDARCRREIEKMYTKMFRMMAEYARSSLQDPSLAEEAVQETFRIACQKPWELLTSSNPEGWLVNTLKYVITNIKREIAESKELLDDYASQRIEEIAASGDHIGVEILYADIAKSEEFVLLKELALDGKSHLELARDRGISVAASRKRVQRAKEILKKKIKK